MWTSVTTRKVDLEGLAHDCGGHFHAISRADTIAIGRRRAAVEQIVFRCDGCGEERQTLAEAGRARHEAAARIQETDRQLAPGEIRRIREERLGLTQSELEQILGLGEKTVVRWETGRVLPTKAADSLLRLLDRDPSAVDFLAAHHGMTRPTNVSTASPREAAVYEWSLPIPRRFRSAIEALAHAEGVDAATLVVWIIADAVTGSHTRALHSQVTAMHQDLASRIDSLDAIWRQPRVDLTGRHKPDVTLSYKAPQPYAASA